MQFGDTICISLMLRRVFECDDVSMAEMETIQFNTELSVAHMLKAIKKFFIEQDICDWAIPAGI